MGRKIKQPSKCYDKKPFSKNEAERLCLQEPLVNGNQNLNLKGKPHGHNLSPVKGVIIPMSPCKLNGLPYPEEDYHCIPGPYLTHRAHSSAGGGKGLPPHRCTFPWHSQTQGYGTARFSFTEQPKQFFFFFSGMKPRCECFQQGWIPACFCCFTANKHHAKQVMCSLLNASTSRLLQRLSCHWASYTRTGLWLVFPPQRGGNKSSHLQAQHPWKFRAGRKCQNQPGVAMQQLAKSISYWLC